jgi:hypothetical protein
MEQIRHRKRPDPAKLRRLSVAAQAFRLMRGEFTAVMRASRTEVRGRRTEPMVSRCTP